MYKNMQCLVSMTFNIFKDLHLSSIINKFENRTKNNMRLNINKYNII